MTRDEFGNTVPEENALGKPAPEPWSARRLVKPGHVLGWAIVDADGKPVASCRSGANAIHIANLREENKRLRAERDEARAYAERYPGEEYRECPASLTSAELVKFKGATGTFGACPECGEGGVGRVPKDNPRTGGKIRIHGRKMPVPFPWKQREASGNGE